MNGKEAVWVGLVHLVYSNAEVTSHVDLTVILNSCGKGGQIWRRGVGKVFHRMSRGRRLWIQVEMGLSWVMGKVGIVL